MIKYNSKTINDIDFGTLNMVKVYRGNVICYYKTSGGDSPLPPTPQTPCYAVVPNISQYQDTEFEDVFNMADGKWYKLNNLNEYEEYGVYASGRTECGGETPSRLPSGYTEVEYIENTGTSYIDTNFKANQDTRIKLTAQTVTSQPSGKLIGAGAYNRVNAMQFCYEPSSTGSLVVSWGTVAGWTTYSSCIGDYNVHTYDWNKNEFYRDETLIGSVTFDYFQCSDNLGIFRHIQAGDNPSAASYFKGKLFSFQIFDNGTLVRNMIPAMRDSDSKYGLYDIVTNTFHTSPNGNNFVGGNPITPTQCVTTYEGKLTLDDGYEYIYSGGSWVNLGEVSGGTATLPNVPFTINYNAKNYNSQTKTLAKTNGQLANTDVTITDGSITYDASNGYITVPSGSKGVIGGYTTYFNRTSSNPTLTIISKQKTSSTNDCHLLANRTSQGDYNWMYRTYGNKLTLHGSSEQGSLAVTTQPVIESVRINDSKTATYNNYTDNTTSSQSNFSYGPANPSDAALFCGYSNREDDEFFVGDFYWIYMSQTCLTDEQVQDVIDYNEGNAQTIYPMYYAVMQDPPNNISFSSMTEAEEYECPWVGMKATIDGVKYVFSSGYTWELRISNDTITYEAPSKLTETTSTSSGGLHTNAFNTTIQSHTFENGVGTIVFNDDVTSIGNYAFYKCTSLTSIEIPDSVTSIGSNTFRECSGLTSIDIPNNLTSIGDYAFQGCSSLTSIDIPSGVTSIGKQAFNSCSSLTSIDIPNSVTSIGNAAFQYCSGLTSVTIPNSVTSIGNQAFYGCSSLTSINIPSGVTSIGTQFFYNCSSLTSIDIPNSVTSIGDYAFQGCSSLTSIDIPNSVTSIGNSAFNKCSGLTSIDIPNSVTSIGDGAFGYCTSLSSITIPNSVTSIYNGAFYRCSSLTSITVESTTPPTLGIYVFDNTNNCPIYVPFASVNTYKAASGWSTYSSRIQAIA